MGLGPEAPRALGLGQLAEEALEAGGRAHGQRPPRAWDDASLSVRHAARPEGHPAGSSDAELLVADLEHVLSLEHEEEFILALVHVPRGVEWIYLLDDREGAARALGGCLDQDLRPAEPQALAPVRVQSVGEGAL